MKYFKALRLFGVLLSIAVLSACSPAVTSQPAITGRVRVVVTKNFGAEVLVDKAVETNGNLGALEALKKVAQVETGYGGGFVGGINGLRTTFTGTGATRQDWFFYVNGMLSNTGSLDNSLRPGDTEQWDYHDWGFQQVIPAVIGQFPEPFLHGYGGRTKPTVIAFAPAFEEAAGSIERRLTELGVKTVSRKKIAELSPSEKESSNLILLAPPDNGLVMEMNRERVRLGFFAYFDKGDLVVLDADGKVAGTYGAGAGLIQATQNPWNPDGIGSDENVAWLVSGTDESSIKAAADALVIHYDELKYAFAAVVVNGKTIKVP